MQNRASNHEVPPTQKTSGHKSIARQKVTLDFFFYFLGDVYVKNTIKNDFKLLKKKLLKANRSISNLEDKDVFYLISCYVKHSFIKSLETTNCKEFYELIDASLETLSESSALSPQEASKAFENKIFSLIVEKTFLLDDKTSIAEYIMNAFKFNELSQLLITAGYEEDIALHLIKLSFLSGYAQLLQHILLNDDKYKQTSIMKTAINHAENTEYLAHHIQTYKPYQPTLLNKKQTREPIIVEQVRPETTAINFAPMTPPSTPPHATPVDHQPKLGFFSRHRSPILILASTTLGLVIGGGLGLIATIATGGAAAPLLPAIVIAGGLIGAAGGAMRSCCLSPHQPQGYELVADIDEEEDEDDEGEIKEFKQENRSPKSQPKNRPLEVFSTTHTDEKNEDHAHDSEEKPTKAASRHSMRLFPTGQGVKNKGDERQTPQDKFRPNGSFT